MSTILENNTNSRGKNSSKASSVQQQHVYRVENVNLDNPQAVKDALSSAAAKSSKNSIEGIDLNNLASVAIVDYVPEEAANSSDENNNKVDEDDDDGFKPVLTKRSRKAEKLRQAQAAAQAAAAQAALIAKARVPKSASGSNKSNSSQAVSNKHSHNHASSTVAATAAKKPTVEPLMTKVLPKPPTTANQSAAKNEWISNQSMLLFMCL